MGIGHSRTPPPRRQHEPDATRQHVFALLQRHGRHATSFQILEPGFSYWFDRTDAPSSGRSRDPTDATGADAVVAYVEAAGCRVVAGAPLAAPAVVGEVAARFVADSRRAGLRVVFFSVEADFVEALSALPDPPRFEALKIAEQPEWVPGAYSDAGPARRTLRAQVNRARNKGVAVRRVDTAEITRRNGAIRMGVEGVLRHWLRSRRMSVMRFLVDLEPFAYYPEARRYYIATLDERVVGFLAAIPVYQRSGWFFEDVIREPEAPNGTAELLIDAALRDARDEGDGYVTLGMAPLSGVTTERGPHRLLRAGMRWCYDRLGVLYRFDGVRAFKARFHPDRWVDQLVVACPPPSGVRAIHAILAAFAGGGLVSFGVDTAWRLLNRVPARAWSNVLFLLAALLVPWTALLAHADGQRWFGDESIQWAWVTFDAVMVGALGGLGVLVRRGRRAARPLSLLMAGATLTDFILTGVQALHLHAAVTGWALAFVAAGAAGPAIATLVLALLWSTFRGPADGPGG